MKNRITKIGGLTLLLVLLVSSIVMASGAPFRAQFGDGFATKGTLINPKDLPVFIGNETISKPVPIGLRYIPVNLGEKFQLKQGQTVVVKDYKAMVITYVAESTYTKKQNSEAMPFKEEILLHVEMPSRKMELVYPLRQSSIDITLGVGETKDAFGAKISLLSLENGIATLVVSKTTLFIGGGGVGEIINPPFRVNATVAPGVLINPRDLPVSNGSSGEVKIVPIGRLYEKK